MASEQNSHDDEPGDVVSVQNVGNLERTLSTFFGAYLVYRGIRRMKLSGAAMTAAGGALIYRGVTGHCAVYEALEKDTANDEHPTRSSLHVEKSVVVQKPPEELYRFWRSVENLPRFMPHLKEVRPVGDKLSYWTVKGPAGTDIEWAAEIINDVPNSLIAWQSLPESDVENAGSVHFKELQNGRGTEVRVVITYKPPLGKLGDTIAKLLGESPDQEIENDLKRFKEIIEAHEPVSAA